MFLLQESISYILAEGSTTDQTHHKVPALILPFINIKILFNFANIPLAYTNRATSH